MTLSEITKYVVTLFSSDELVNTIALSDNDLIDTKKENIYPLVSISFNGEELSPDDLKKYDFTISVLQQRDSTRKVTPSKLMDETNWIDNMNECDSICTNFINYINRYELNNISIDSLSILEPLNRFGGADLDGFRFDITLSTPNSGSCSPGAYVVFDPAVVPYPDFELLSNKSNEYTEDSDKYYTAEYVNTLSTGGGGGSTPDATTTIKGKLKLAGHLSGTADLPTVPGLAILQSNIDNLTTADIPDSTDKRYVTDANLVKVNAINQSVSQAEKDTWNSKEPEIFIGTIAQYFAGDKSWRNFAAEVGTSLLGGLSTATNAVITSADSVLSAFGKLQAQINNLANIYATKSMSAYSFRVNNTSVGANAAETNYRAPGKQVLTSTITWTGTTAPSGATNHSYNWEQIGNIVFLNISLAYATVSSATTSVTIALPSDCPTPVKPDGYTVALNRLYIGTGYFSLNLTGSAAIAQACFLRSNAANNGFEIISTQASSGHLSVNIQMQYFTS